MALQSLEWRKLPVVTTSVTSSTSGFLNIIYNMLTGSTYFDGSSRTAGSASAWSVTGRFITGSNTEAVYCSPPYITQLSQSILFVGKNNSGAVSGGSPTLSTNESSFAVASIYAGLSKNSGTFTNWTGSLPMGSGSSFTGYMRLNTSAIGGYSNLKITIYESKEAIALDVGLSLSPTTNLTIIGGALIDPQQSVTVTDAESDGRIYCLLRSNTSSGIDASVWPVASTFLDHNTAASGARAVGFFPQQTTTSTIICYKFVQDTSVSTGISLSLKLTKLPLYVSNYNIPYQFLGVYRDIYAIKDFQNNLVLRDGSSNIIGFTMSSSDVSTNDTILLSYT